MAEFKFSNADFKTEAARSKTKAKTARTSMLAGLVASLDELSDDGASAFEMQRALGHGALSAQKKELERLIKKHGYDHPYVIAAKVQSETLIGLAGDVGDLTRRAGHLLESFSETSVFHGYVFSDAGEGASGVVVELRLALRDGAESAPASAIRTFQANTNSEGYFRMELEQHDGALDDSRQISRIMKSPDVEFSDAAGAKTDGLFRAMNSMKNTTAENLVRTPTERESSAAADAAAKKTADAASKNTAPGAASGTTHYDRPTFRSEVRILDMAEKNKVLLNDLTPPEFVGKLADGKLELRTQFRLYALP